MARHQHGIFAEGTRAHHHLELTVRGGTSDAELAAALAAVRAVNVDHRTTGGVNLVLGFGPTTWDRLRGGRPPAPVRDFPGYRSTDGAFTAPATQRDLWVWAHGATVDVVYDVIRGAAKALAPVAELQLDVTGFTYHDSRDLTGFIDGSANPYLDEAPSLVVIPDGEPGEGGCCAMTMRFRHDLDAFGSLDEHEQELVFGRTKRDSVELDDDLRPPDAHISLAEVAGDDGEELEVYRRSVPWADAVDQGLQFVSFGPDVDRFDRQLRALYGVDDPSLVDRLQRFTTALTGSFWFCPSVEDLDAVAPLPDDED
jgi:putative iron-dependent peroxidase